MKKLHQDYAAQQKRRIHCAEKRTHSKRFLRQKRNKSDNSVLLAKAFRRRAVMMENVCSFLPDYIDKTIEKIDDIRSLIEGGDRVFIDFSRTIQITANFSVYFLSEIRLLSDVHGSDCVKFNLSNLPPQTYFLLKGLGLLRYAEKIQPNIRGGLLPIIEGTGGHQGIDEIIDFVVKVAIDKGEIPRESKAEAEALVSRALNEAILNVDYHAYPNLDKSDKTWWITAAIIDGNLYLSLCDRGVGMPTTIPRQAWFEHVLGALPINDDATMIQAAMKYTRTSAKKRKSDKRHGRGLGTKDIQSLVLKHQKGSLVVISQRGYYKLIGESAKEELVPLKRPLKGTSVNWKIPLEN